MALDIYNGKVDSKMWKLLKWLAKALITIGLVLASITCSVYAANTEEKVSTDKQWKYERVDVGVIITG